MVVTVEKKELTKLITKSLFAVYMVFHFGVFNILSILIAWPIIVGLGIDLYNNVIKKGVRTKKRKMSDEELSLVSRIEAHLVNHDQIKVNDNISLKLTKEGRDVYESLGVFFAGEYVSQLVDFRTYDLDTYQTILTEMRFDDNVVDDKEPSLNAEGFIEQINEYNTDIAHDDISNYLYLTSSLLSNISILEKRGVSDSRKTRKLYMYYMPILMDILDNYCKMKDNKYVSSDVKQMEEKLIKTIILCNEAIKTLLASLNEEDLLNMSVNMNTLENILKKDGLIKTAGMDRVKEAVK